MPWWRVSWQHWWRRRRCRSPQLPVRAWCATAQPWVMTCCGALRLPCQSPSPLRLCAPSPLPPHTQQVTASCLRPMPHILHWGMVDPNHSKQTNTARPWARAQVAPSDIHQVTPGGVAAVARKATAGEGGAFAAAIKRVMIGKVSGTYRSCGVRCMRPSTQPGASLPAERRA